MIREVGAGFQRACGVRNLVALLGGLAVVAFGAVALAAGGGSGKGPTTGGRVTVRGFPIPAQSETPNAFFFDVKVDAPPNCKVSGVEIFLQLRCPGPPSYRIPVSGEPPEITMTEIEEWWRGQFNEEPPWREPKGKDEDGEEKDPPGFLSWCNVDYVVRVTFTCTTPDGPVVETVEVEAFNIEE